MWIRRHLDAGSAAQCWLDDWRFDRAHGSFVAAKIQIGPNAFSEGLLYSSFPAALMLSSECTVLKRYSPGARIAMSGGGALFVILVTWAAVAIGNLI